MGLFTGLITLPLAPVRGVAWVAQQVAEEAERRNNDDSGLRRELLELELDHDAGLIGDEEYAARSDELARAISERHAAARSRAEPRYEEALYEEPPYEEGE